MTDLREKNRQPTTDRPPISPSLLATAATEYTDEQIEAASRPPSLESVFAAHLRLLAVQDAEWHDLYR